MRQQQHRLSSLSVLVAGVVMLLLASLACTLSTSAPDRQMDTVVRDLGTSVAAQSTVTARLAERLADLPTPDPELGTAVARSGTMVSYLATRVMALDQEHGIVPTTVRPTETPFALVEGSVEIEGGRCCAGGTAGETIQIRVDFTASSSAEEVTEMRVAIGGIRFDEAALTDVAWEPFVPQKTYPVKVVINWVGFWVSVQYRDEVGTVSSVFYDDISIEGTPAEPDP